MYARPSAEWSIEELERSNLGDENINVRSDLAIHY